MGSHFTHRKLPLVTTLNAILEIFVCWFRSARLVQPIDFRPLASTNKTLIWFRSSRLKRRRLFYIFFIWALQRKINTDVDGAVTFSLCDVLLNDDVLIGVVLRGILAAGYFVWLQLNCCGAVGQCLALELPSKWCPTLKRVSDSWQ